MADLRRRRLGRTGLDVSELSFGTGPLARAEAGEAAKALALALERGIDGIEIDAGDLPLAERIGEVLRRAGAQHRVQVFARVSSLVHFDLPSPHILMQDAYPGEHIRAQTEALLRALGVERLAVQQLHAWCPEWLEEGDWRETLERLRGEGKVAGIGISLFDHDIAAAAPAIASSAVDCVQAMFNLFDSSFAALFPLCQEHDVGVIARSPLYFGALAGRLGDYPADDWRQAYFYEEHARETAARAERVDGGAETALRFALTYAAVSTVVIGMRSREQVEANLRAAARGPFDVERMRSLSAHRWLC